MIMHTVCIEDFDDVIDVRLASNKGKKLDMKVIPAKKRVWYEVSQGKSTICAVPTIEEAIHIYNNI
jgi:hypothetical protein